MRLRVVCGLAVTMESPLAQEGVEEGGFTRVGTTC